MIRIRIEFDSSSLSAIEVEADHRIALEDGLNIAINALSDAPSARDCLRLVGVLGVRP